MNALAALLVADHLNDLMREAEEERRLRILRGARPKPAGRLLRLGPRIASIINRLRDQVSRSTKPRPAGA